jgi:hypothetical protein
LAPAAADGGLTVTVGWLIELPATTLYGAEFTGVVSDVVETATVSEPDGVPGFVIPLTVTLTLSPAAMLALLNSEHVIDWPEGPEQLPTFVAEVVSRTEDVKNVVRFVPAGNVIVIWPPPALASMPVADVVNDTTYTVLAPAAADGGVIATETPLTDVAWATPAKPVSSTHSAPIAATAARMRRRVAGVDHRLSPRSPVLMPASPSQSVAPISRL